MIFKKRDKGTWDGIEKAATMGTNFVAHTVVGLVIGYYCDKWFGTEPWGLIFWLLMGIVAGFRTMYLDAMKMSRNQSLDTTPEAKPEENSGGAGPDKSAGDVPGKEGKPDA
ncbi:MAG: AtpZ/AtpI family protein [Thermodesulfobacteriota bacterium]|jgi:ATP synthase protein I